MEIVTLNTAGELNRDHIEKLFNDDYLALRISDFLPDPAVRAFKKFIQTQHMEDYKYVGVENGEKKEVYLGVKRVGRSFNTTYDQSNTKARDEYFELARKNTTFFREKVPHLNPVDHLRLLFDELWPQRVGLACYEGNKTFAGVPRITFAEDSPSMEKPHYDALPAKFKTLLKQFSVNVYLEIPDTGGELEIWPERPLSADEVYQVDMKSDLRQKLGKSVLLKPLKGEAILFNTRRAHAIRSFPDGCRIGMQSFIGLEQNGELIFWS